MSIKDLPKHQRPREKLIERGVENLSDKELMAILLRTGRAGKSVLDIAEELFRKFPMKELLKATYEDLVRIKGVDSGKACTLLASLELARRVLELDNGSLPKISTAREAVAQLSDIRSSKREHFSVLYLNARSQLIHKEIISIGSLDASIVHPREVFEPAIRRFASQAIVAHNHPSGDPTPSEADFEVTGRLKAAGHILGIEIIDHIIICEKNYCSLREKGVMRDC